jgi:small subunit ribosomal protein S20
VANIKSAIKRIDIAERNRLRNKAYKSAVKTLTKNYLQAVEAYSAEPSPETLAEVEARLAAAYSKIDKAVKRHALHRNNGARKKASLARALKQVAATAS